MIELNMSDVISVLESCRQYLIALAVILAAGIILTAAVRKLPKAKKKLIRGEAAIAMVLGICVVVNLICFGPMNTLLSLATGGSGTISGETTTQSNEDCRQVAREGIVLLENDGLLPLEEKSNINVFGWASANPVYGGSGAGALNDLYDRVTLLEGLTDAGFTVNQELTKFYSDFGGQRADYGTDWSLPEPTADSYSAALLDNATTFSDTALVVIGRWGGEGADLPSDMSAVSYTSNSSEYDDFEAGQSYLELSRTEKDLLDLVCGNFENVVLVYNGLTTFEMGFVRDYPQIRSVLWCAGPGQTGFDALGEILCGITNPSGKTADTFVYDLSRAPWWNNFGSFIYDNMSEFTVDASDPYMGGTVPTFVNYVEGIYVGYRFYETAAAEGFLDYEETVQYPFGYGLSYTGFEQKLTAKDNGDGTIDMEVSVTNTGAAAGKDVVQIYYNPPYTNGGIEKASVNLIEYAKTDLLMPGESCTLHFTISAEDMASYDESGNGCYVLEEGDYVLSLNADSHTVIDTFEYRVDSTVVYDADSARSTDLTAAVNQFADAAGEVTYLSRADGFANYAEATAVPKTLSMYPEGKDSFIWTANYEMEKLDVEMPVTGAKNGLSLAAMRGKAYDDPAWGQLLDQLTVEEMNDMIAHGGFQTAAAPSVGKVSTVDCDGPSAVSNNFTKAGSVGFPSNILLACTWNDELAESYGSDMGKMAGELGASGWYAPSANPHRSALGGRTYEYYSEDPMICGRMAACAVIGAEKYGVYGYIKHFAMNEQETNRWAMLCTWANEQTIREIYLKPFEVCVKDGHAKAVMSSFNYIGPVWAGGHKALLTNVLKKEWGFEGFIDTDYFAGSFNMNADQVIEAGGANCLSTFDVGTNYISDTSDPTSVTYMRRAAHDILYTVVNSRAYYDENLSMGIDGWKKAAIAIDVIIAALLIGGEVIVIKKYRKNKEEK